MPPTIRRNSARDTPAIETIAEQSHGHLSQEPQTVTAQRRVPLEHIAQFTMNHATVVATGAALLRWTVKDPFNASGTADCT